MTAQDADPSVFREGEEVRHKGEGIKGEVVNSEAGNLRVEWADGHETTESHHTVELVSGGDSE